ncbi:MAG: tetratricopeptide repeat protein [Candidatus Acidiferrales bacterium]
MSEQKKSRRQMLEEFLAARPDDAFSRYGLALECVNAGDAPAAEEHFRKLIEANPDYVPAYLQFGQFLAGQSRRDEARRVLSAGVIVAHKRGDQHARSEMETLLTDLA